MEDVAVLLGAQHIVRNGLAAGYRVSPKVNCGVMSMVDSIGIQYRLRRHVDIQRRCV